MCQGLALGPGFNGRVLGERHWRPRGRLAHLVEVRRELTAGLWYPIAASISVPTDLCGSNQQPGLVDPGGGLDPRRLPPPVLADDRGESYPGWSGNLVRRWAGTRAYVRRIACRPSGTCVLRKTISNRGAGSGMCARGPMSYLYVLPDSPDDGPVATAWSRLLPRRPLCNR